MILLREVQECDLDALEKFTQIPGLFNLPNDRELLRERILRSIASFHGTLKNKADAKFIFVAEDLESSEILGTSMIAPQHGTTEAPHFYFEVGSEEKFSEMINTGFIHGTLKLKYDTNGPSELGGLVVDPSARSSDAKVGRQISFVRFLFLGMNRQKFKKKILAELLPPLNKKGQSPLWEAIGRRFTNMDYWEADQLCQKNKEFIFSLFPSGKIYTTFLPAEARDAIGKVGKETEPVVHMLKKIGFEYKNQVDPFDGGPHLWANVDDLLPIKKMSTAAFELELGEGNQMNGAEIGLLTKAHGGPGQFRSLAVKINRNEGRLRCLEPQAETVSQLLDLRPGDQVVFMPYY